MGLGLHSNSGAQSPAVKVGGQKHDPQSSPSCLSGSAVGGPIFYLKVKEIPHCFSITLVNNNPKMYVLQL